MLTAEQETAFRFCHAGVTWFYNEAAASQLDRYRHHVPVETYKQRLSYAVTAARQAGVEFPYQGGLRLIADVPAVFLYGALRQLSGSWTRHLKALAGWNRNPHAPGQRCPSSPPRFRSVHRGGSLYWQVKGENGPRPLGKTVIVTGKATGSRPATAEFRVPGVIGVIRIRYHRELPADTLVRFAVLRADALGRYWVLLQYDTAQVRQPAAGGITGVDRGVAVTIATADGAAYHTPVLSAGQQQRKDRLQRTLSRKRRLNPCRHDVWVTVRGRSKLIRHYCPPPGHPAHDCGCWKHSARYARDKLAYLKLSQRQVRQRTAGAHLASRALADRYAMVVMEDLDVSAMTSSARGTAEQPGSQVRAKAGLNRAILARNWYQVMQFTAYKTQVAAVPAAYTSQTCPRCGHVDAANRPDRDTFRCVRCGLEGHADVVAARNILDRYTAAAQAVAGRETCLGVSQQPVNSLPNSIVTSPGEHPGAESPSGERSHPGQERGYAGLTENLIPGAYGRVGARKPPERRRSRQTRKRSPGNGA
jgi:transposase